MLYSFFSINEKMLGVAQPTGLATPTFFIEPFICMRFKESKDYEAQKTHRKKALKACGLSLKKIDLFQKNVVPKMYPRLDEHDFQRLIIDFMNSQ